MRDGTQFDITFERSLNLQIYSRSGYTILDLIANVGGLRTIMAFVLTQLMGYWNFNSVQNYMVSRLFSYKCVASAKPDSEPMQINGKTNGLAEYAISLVPASCKRRKSDNQRVLAMGRVRLDRETSIV